MSPIGSSPQSSSIITWSQFSSWSACFSCFCSILSLTSYLAFNDIQSILMALCLSGLSGTGFRGICSNHSVPESPLRQHLYCTNTAAFWSVSVHSVSPSDGWPCSRLPQGDTGQWEDLEAGTTTENKPASRHFYPIALLLVSSHLLVVWLILSLVFLLAKYQ